MSYESRYLAVKEEDEHDDTLYRVVKCPECGRTCELMDEYCPECGELVDYTAHQDDEDDLEEVDQDDLGYESDSDEYDEEEDEDYAVHGEEDYYEMESVTYNDDYDAEETTDEDYY